MGKLLFFYKPNFNDTELKMPGLNWTIFTRKRRFEDIAM